MFTLFMGGIMYRATIREERVIGMWLVRGLSANYRMT